MDPHFVIGRFALAHVHEAKGKAESAISFAQEAIALSRGTQLFLIADLGHAYATAGKKDEAMGVLRQLAEIGKQRYVDPCLSGLDPNFETTKEPVGDRFRVVTCLERKSH